MAENTGSEQQEMDFDSVADEVVEHVFPDVAASQGAEEGELVDSKGTPAPSAVEPEPTAPSKPPASTALGGGQPAPVATNLPGAVEPPPGLSAEIKQQWATLPPQVQAEFAKREQDFHKGLQELKPAAETGQYAFKLFGPYQELYQQYGVNPWEHASNLLQSHAVLLFGRPEQKTYLLTELCKEAGIDPRSLATGAPQMLPEAFTQLQQEIGRLRGQLGNVTGQMSAAEATKLEAQVMRMMNDQENFPDFLEAGPVMVELLNQNPKLGFEAAYKQAVLQHPVLRQKAIDREVEKRLASKQTTLRTKADSANRTRAVRVKSNSSPARPTAPAGDDLDATLRETFAEINSR